MANIKNIYNGSVQTGASFWTNFSGSYPIISFNLIEYSSGDVSLSLTASVGDASTYAGATLVLPNSALPSWLASPSIRTINISNSPLLPYQSVALIGQGLSIQFLNRNAANPTAVSEILTSAWGQLGGPPVDFSTASTPNVSVMYTLRNNILEIYITPMKAVVTVASTSLPIVISGVNSLSATSPIAQFLKSWLKYHQPEGTTEPFTRGELYISTPVLVKPNGSISDYDARAGMVYMQFTIDVSTASGVNMISMSVICPSGAVSVGDQYRIFGGVITPGASSGGIVTTLVLPVT